MILFYDTETTGLPDFKARSADPIQPHIVQLALVTCDDSGKEIETKSVIVKPDGWVIPADMAAIHGISHERAMDEGIPEQRATAMFVMNQARCALRVAHNESFDRRIMRIAMTRLGLERDFIEFIEARKSYCTCDKSKPLCNLPPTPKMVEKGMSGPKSPKLTECIQFFFKEEMKGAHDALADARACARIYFELNKSKETANVT
jgi:DNA polymerase-3 subunit epsilon